MFSKVDVNGENEAELYTLLKTAQPGEGETSDITWNFEKFLVDREGDVVKRYPPPITPEEVADDLDEFR